jgi:phage shock protein E
MIVAVVAVVAFVLWQRLGLVEVRKARELLQHGALVIDVRSESEFQGRHFPKAINIPLGDLADTIARHVPDKDRPLLLHCLSGGRSGIARTTLKRMGYRQVYNLGSYGRAAAVLGRPHARI